jgi:hypothetical protein
MNSRMMNAKWTKLVAKDIVDNRGAEWTMDGGNSRSLE